MSKTTKTTKTTTTASKNGGAPAASITPEQAMLVIGEFARERGNGWREALRAFWIGEGDESVLYAARALVPAAILDNLNFAPPKKPRALKPLSPAQDAARRLGKVASAMRAQAMVLCEGVSMSVVSMMHKRDLNKVADLQKESLGLCVGLANDRWLTQSIDKLSKYESELCQREEALGKWFKKESTRLPHFEGYVIRQFKAKATRNLAPIEETDRLLDFVEALVL